MISRSLLRAAELMTRTGSVVTLEVAKQGAIYHGLATLLNQPSPMMPRGKVTHRHTVLHSWSLVANCGVDFILASSHFPVIFFSFIPKHPYYFLLVFTLPLVFPQVKLLISHFLCSYFTEICTHISDIGEPKKKSNIEILSDIYMNTHKHTFFAVIP